MLNAESAKLSEAGASEHNTTLLHPPSCPARLLNWVSKISVYLPSHHSSTLQEPGSPERTDVDHILGWAGERGCLNFFFTEADVQIYLSSH